MNLSPQKALTDLASAVDVEFARHFSYGTAIEIISKERIEWVAEQMKTFICSYIDLKAEMHSKIIEQLSTRS